MILIIAERKFWVGLCLFLWVFGIRGYWFGKISDKRKSVVKIWIQQSILVFMIWMSVAIVWNQDISLVRGCLGKLILSI